VFSKGRLEENARLEAGVPLGAGMQMYVYDGCPPFEKRVCGYAGVEP
jgi:hypothetical protein